MPRWISGFELMQSSFTAAQFCGEYLPKTQTFMYFQFVSFRRVRPVVVSYQPFENLDLFPLNGIERVQVIPQRASVARMFETAGRRVFGKQWLEERRLNRLAHTLQSYPIQVIHAHFGPTGYMALPLKERLKVPLITTFYGRDAGVEEDYWDRKELFARGDLFLVEGKHLAEQLAGRGCAREKIRVQ